MPGDCSTHHHPIAEEDRWRLITYRLLARLLASAPDALLLEHITINKDCQSNSEIIMSWNQLAGSARQRPLLHIQQEYQTVFIGLTSGEIVPYASRYLTGHLMEKPLAVLRQDLQRLGIHRQDDVNEPEDHISALLETMSLLIESGDDFQWIFLEKHLLCWTNQLFNDLLAADSARFYRHVAAFGQAFMSLETTQLSMHTNQTNHAL
ncbi:MAG: molecular chaperone TorD family protein [Gammaproteobacteria bacterium]|nr:molecular chaperone TorD family protein [Gammaproteobacteria bacterium]